ncbi:hypothetical protein INR49_031177 [Caranx melampygus]|nr:hypothetical protein INR49_031177 [Caranx melampygus]
MSQPAVRDTRQSLHGAAAQCCGQTPYGLAQVGVLCCNTTLYKNIEDGYECSETGILYNASMGTVCCSHFHPSPGQHCCGAGTYTPHSEICCNGHRHLKEKNSQCCGIKAFNIKDPHMKCCGDRLYNLTSFGKHWHEAPCCGSILQGPQDVCCSSDSTELLYSKKTEFRCCGHRYFNTSLWSCCAGKLSPVQKPGKLTESTFLSMKNLDKEKLCKEVKMGTVESVSVRTIVFNSVLKINGTTATVRALPSHNILTGHDRCNTPKDPWQNLLV